MFNLLVHLQKQKLSIMKYKFLLLFLLTSVVTFAQDLTSLKNDAQKVFDFTIAKNYDATLDYTYPKVFDIIPREQMLEVLNNMLDNESMSITIENVRPDFTFSNELVINKAKYYVIEHNNRMIMKFKTELGEEKDAMLEYLTQSMPSYKVSFDEKTKSFIVDGKAKIIAISDEITKGTWKFLNYNGDSPMMEQVLGKEVLEKLGL